MPVLLAACLAKRGNVCAMRSGFALTLTLATSGGRERKSKIGEIVSRKRFNNERINEMSDKRQETIADIVAEMRIGDLCAEDTSASRPEFINDFLASYADRIEAAAKRECEAGAEAAQICGEIGEMIGREATCSKSSQVGNASTVQDIAQEMLNTSMQSITAERINGWAMRLAEACEQSVTDSNHFGNAAKMREALEDARRFVSASAHRTDRDLLIMDEKRGAYVLTPKETLIKIDDVLSAPPRNCDRFATLDDARNTFFADYVPDETRSSATAFAIWLFDKAKGEADEQK